MEDCNQEGFCLILCHASMQDKILICNISFIWKEIKLLFAQLKSHGWLYSKLLFFKKFWWEEKSSLHPPNLPVFQENAMGDSITGFTKVQVGNIYSLSLIHQAGYLVINGDQVGQARGSLFHNLLQGQAERLWFLRSSFWPFLCIGVTLSSFQSSGPPWLARTGKWWRAAW